MLQRVGECGALTTKMLSHGPRSRRLSSQWEVCEASGAAATCEKEREKTSVRSPDCFKQLDVSETRGRNLRIFTPLVPS